MNLKDFILTINNMQINHKLKIIILGATLFLYKTFNYYYSDDSIHMNHTLTEEIEELNFNNKILF